MDDNGAFIKIIRPGANRDGYWTLDQFAIQLEDLCDVILVMYPERLHIISLDNSANHRGKRPGGLDPKRMNKHYGGAQLKMDKTVVPQNMEGIVGDLYDNGGRRLAPGATQHTTFQEGDEGPYWLSPEDREILKHRVATGKKVSKALTKAELSEAIICHYPKTKDQASASKPLSFLRGLAERLKVPTFRQVDEYVKGSGWMGAQKGGLQMAMERGLIDATRPIKYYSKKEVLDILAACDDFKNELCLLEWVGAKYNVKIVFSAKGYCDVAGFGIEYIWAVAKNFIHRKPLKEREKWDDFDTIFREAVSTKVLTMKAVRGCGRKCRNFQRAYLLAAAADKVSLSESNRISINDLIHSVDPVPYQKLLQIQKGVKTHRNVADFCGKDILCIIKNS